MMRFKSPHSYVCTMRHPTRTLTLHRYRRKAAQIEPPLFSYNSLCARGLRCISFRFSRILRMGFTSRSSVRVGHRKTSRMYKYWPQTFLNCLYVCDSPFPSPYLHLFWFILSKTMSSCTFIKKQPFSYVAMARRACYDGKYLSGKDDCGGA